MFLDLILMVVSGEGLFFRICSFSLAFLQYVSDYGWVGSFRIFFFNQVVIRNLKRTLIHLAVCPLVLREFHHSVVFC